MASIQLHDKVFKPYIDRKEVETIIDKMAHDISQIDDEDLLVVIVLNGSMFFAIELLQRIVRPWEIDTMRLASYHGGLQSSGQVEFLLDVKAEVNGRNVLLIEDIVDTGRTLAFLHDHFKGLGAKKIMTATLLHKPSQRINDTPVEYIGKDIDDAFVVGFGLDYRELGRNLPEIYVLES